MESQDADLVELGLRLGAAATQPPSSSRSTRNLAETRDPTAMDLPDYRSVVTAFDSADSGPEPTTLAARTLNR